MSFNIPILFLAFNRPEYTLSVFEKIKEINPSKLYICLDGPRPDNANDYKNCTEVKRIVQDFDNSKCHVSYLFREKNLGCKNSVSDAITWFFSNEEMGIILEDDCLPNLDFFLFTESMLLRYKDDTRIGIVSGTNMFSSQFIQNKESYFFSKTFNIWGWATWKRVWDQYDVNVKSWRDDISSAQLAYNVPNFLIKKHFEIMFDIVKNKKIDTWDFQLVFSCLFNNMLSIIPNVNLISNIGIEGIHSSSLNDSHFREVYSLENELHHPKYITPNYLYDLNFYYKKSYKATIIFLIRKFVISIFGLKFFYFIKKLKCK